MASYHLRAQIIKKSKGRSAIAAAAYRAAERLEDREIGKVYDFSNKRGVSHREILIPDGAAPWLADRQKLWSHVHALETRRDAQLARELDIALPHELTAEQRRELLLGFVREQFVSRGMVADVCFHDPVPDNGDSPHNFHAHVMLTLRKATKHGLHDVKTREWNSAELLKEWRAAWSEHHNQTLERYGHRARVDHRTLKAQKEDAERRGDRGAALTLDREPEIHIGARANKLAKQERKLRSRDREAGPYRKKPGARPRRRTVAYSKLDKGSRLSHNLDIIKGNIDRLGGHVKRYQKLSALFRHRRHYIEQSEFESLLADKREQTRHQRQRDRDQAAVLRAMTQPTFKAKHRKKRKGLADHLIGEVERALASLLGVRERALSRHAFLGRKRNKSRSLFRPKRRSRSLFGDHHP